MIALMLALAAPAPLAPLDFLVGHCWRGSLNPTNQDTHCFTRDDKQVRDRHEVVREGKVVYSGETVYVWDPAAEAIRFTYANAGGKVSDGTVRAYGRDLDFGKQATRNGAKQVTVSSRWNRVGEDAYDAIVITDADIGIPRSTRYQRID